MTEWLAHIHKNKFKIDKRPKCKTGYHKTPRGKHRQNTLCQKSQYLVCGGGLSSRVMEIKRKINKWDLIIFKSFYTVKVNHKQNKKSTYGLGENVCKQCYWQGISFQNIQTAHTALIYINWTTQLKSGKKT